MKLKAAIAALVLVALAGAAGALYYYGRLPGFSGLPGQGAPAAGSEAQGPQGIFGIVTEVTQGSIAIKGQDGKVTRLAISASTQAIPQPGPGFEGTAEASQAMAADQIPLNTVVLAIPDRNDPASAQAVLILGPAGGAAGAAAPQAN